jgi:hypothetical protein
MHCCYDANSMSHRGISAALGLVTLWIAVPLSAADPNRDFSGKWTLDPAASRLMRRDMAAEPAFTIVQQDAAIHSSTNASYALNGSETKYRIGGETRSSAVKWEGAALLINTLVSGPREYTIMDRWRLSPDHLTLSITRQIVLGTEQTEELLIYRSEAWRAPVVVRQPPVDEMPRPVPVPISTRPQPAPSGNADVTVPAGTHIALALRNTVDTKHSKEGDRIYLETVYPVAADGRIVIPRGSFVNGTITVSKPAGRIKGKGELYIRFDSLTLPTGATRDFRSRLSAAEGTKVDREEGKVTGERDTAHDVGKVALGTGMGASIGGLIGAASGHALPGIGIGAAAGAAVGLGTVATKNRPDATLRQGTTVEMILDRDISFTLAELVR